MTTRRTAEIFVEKRGSAWQFRPGITAWMDYRPQFQRVSTAGYRVRSVIGIHEQYDLALLTTANIGWLLVVYSTVVQFCIAYVAWFAALARLPASVAAIGTMAVPVIGVVASAIALHEPLGPGQIAALVFTLAGVVLATRS